MNILQKSALVGFTGMLALLAACSSSPHKQARGTASGETITPSARANGTNPKDCSRYAPAREDPSTRGDYTRGGLYKPGVRDTTPDFVPDMDCIAEPVVREEPHSDFGNNSPYFVLGKKYKVLDSASGYVERGTASYYGNKFHGRLTSNHEVYDMYAFTAAHKTLPLPSFARVTNLDNGKSVIVRINDRGPFHDSRVIDLSYAAAVKLGITGKGTGNVEVRGLTPRDMRNASTAPADNGPQAPPPGTASGQGVQAVAVALDDAPAAAAPLPAVAVPVSATSVDASPRPTTALPTVANSVQLQVASFANRDNAERALGKLRAAGIAGELLASEDGSHWRLRVPTSETEADGLAQRIAQLGFQRPLRARD